MQINKIHVELRVAGNKFLSALQQARRRRRRRLCPESAPPKRRVVRGKLETSHWVSLYCVTFSPIFRIFVFLTFSVAAAHATTRCEIVFLMNQM